MEKVVGREIKLLDRAPWVPDIGTLPMKRRISGNRSGGTIALIIGSAWIYLCYSGFKATISFTSVSPDLLIMLFLSLPGFFILLYGINQFIYFEETIIDHDMVTYRRKGLTGMRAWKEPLSNYRGVLKKRQYWSGTESSGGSYAVYSLRLVHADSGKDVELYSVQSGMLRPPPGYDEKWKKYAKLFQLPVLEETEEGEVSAKVDDLDRSLIDRVKEGKLKIEPVDPMTADLGLMAKVEQSGDLWVINCYPVWTIWKSILGVVILCSGLAACYMYQLINPELFRYFLVVVPLCLVAIGISIRKKRNEPEQIAIDKSHIYYRRRDKEKGWVTDDMPIDTITSIGIKADPTNFRRPGDIVIEGKRRNFRFGWWLPGKTKVKIKNVLLSIIASGAMP